MPNPNNLSGISNASKDILTFIQAERPDVLERNRPAFWYNTDNNSTYFWDTTVNDWLPVKPITTSIGTTAPPPVCNFTFQKEIFA